MSRLFTGLAALSAIFAFAGGSAAAAPGGKLPRPLPAQGQQSVCTAAVLGLAACDAQVVRSNRVELELERPDDRDRLRIRQP